MPKRPKRRFDAQFMDDAAQAFGQVHAQAMQITGGTHVGPMSRIPMIPAAEEIETLPAHCFTCKHKNGDGKSEFQVESEKKLANGAIHKSGKCKNCGQTLSAFVSGVKDAA